MGELMNDALGIGLAAHAARRAAPRARLPRRAREPAQRARQPRDRVVRRRTTETVEEGCLSLPGVHVDVERPVHVRVRAQDEHGEEIVVEASGSRRA